jgi:FAD/FMN-containing dehydrogenase
MTSNRAIAIAIIIFLGMGFTQVVLVFQPVSLVFKTWWYDSDTLPEPPAGQATDGARIEQVPMETVVLPADLDAAVDATRTAFERRMPTAIRGAARSMGGQTLTPDGLRVDVSAVSHVRLDGDLVVAGGGASWHDVLTALRLHGRVPASMPTFRDFTVGGTIAVDAHGWAVQTGSVGDTVRALTVVTPDGMRHELGPDDPLLAATIGGYGLTGVILEARLLTVEDGLLARERHSFLVDALPAAWRELQADPDVVLAHANISVAPSSYLGEAVLTAYRRGGIPGTEMSQLSTIRAGMRAGAMGDGGKELRWRILKADQSARTALYSDTLDVPITFVENRQTAATDILHGYVIPLDGLVAFIAAVGDASADANLLDIDTTFVNTGSPALLSWTDGPAVIVTLRYHEPDRTTAGPPQAAIAARLIDAAHQVGGRPQLGYRLDALTVETLVRAYPTWIAFAAFKRDNDPFGALHNGLWKLAPPEPEPEPPLDEL